MDTRKHNTTQIVDEAKNIHERLVRRHMNPIRFGRTGRNSVYYPNPIQSHWPRKFNFKGKDGTWQYMFREDRLTKRNIHTHLLPGTDRVYLENADKLPNGNKILLHPMVVDIDCETEYQDAREEAALAEEWLYENGVDTPRVALPSTGGKGCHLWLMFERHPNVSATEFNELLNYVGKALRLAVPKRDNSAAHLCVNSNPIKGSLTCELHNPAFDAEIANRPGLWRPANPKDSFYDIVKNEGQWVEAKNPKNLKRYSDSRRICEDENNKIWTWEGPVEQTKLEDYERSKQFERFNYNENLERFILKRGSLIAFPCAGRRDLAPQWIKWYDDAIHHPITMEQVQTLAQLAPTEPAKANPCKQKAKQAKPEKKQHAGTSNGQLTLDFHHGNRSMQRLADPRIQKHEAAYAAAQLALQQTDGNATEDDALELYESYGPATGERTPQRRTRIRGALELARRTYDPTKGSRGSASMSHWYGIPQLSFDQNDLKDLQEHAKHQWPDADQLNNLVTHRRLGYDQIAGVMAVMSKYTLTNPNGQISRDIVIKSLERLGLQLHKDVYQAIKQLLLDTQWLVMTDASWGKGRTAQCYAIGPNAPQMAWIDIYLQAMHVADEFIHSGSLPSINIDVTVCPDHEIEGAPILVMPSPTHSWCVDTFEMNDVFCQST